MKITKKQLCLSVFAIAIIVIALTLTLVKALVPLKFWGTGALYEILFFVFCIAIGFSIMCAYIAFCKKSPWYFFLSATLLGVAVAYAVSYYLAWWIGAIVVLCLLAIIAIISFITAGSHTEEIALNNDGEYKNYEQRKLEKQEQENLIEEKELPKIKSFKD